MTTATAFLQAYTGKPYTAWESAVLDMVRAGSFVRWPMFPVATSYAGHTGITLVSADYLAVGEPSDYMRMPLTPGVAQQVADLLGMVISTPKLVKATWEQASVKLTPTPAPALPSRRQNVGADLSQYAEHDQAVHQQLTQALAGAQEGSVLVSGQKKDVVISSIAKPGKVVIYGWFHPAHAPPPKIDGSGQPIQPLSNVHGDFYVDYSHGIRLCSPLVTLDGQQRDLRELLADKTLSRVFNDEGPCPTRYATPYAVAQKGKASGLADLGSLFVREGKGLT